MTYAHVIYKKTGLERKVTPKAYQLLKNQYTLLGYVDENGNQVDGPQEQVTAVRTQKKSVAPVASEPRKQMSAEEIEAKKAELQEMNRQAIQKAKEEQAKQEAAKIATAVKQHQKPGPKPKNNEA